MEIDKKELEEMLVLYALDELEPDEALAVEEELQRHPELMTQVDKFRNADGLMSNVFVQSDAAAQLPSTKEADIPVVLMPEKAQRNLTHRLGYRMALSVAALALVAVVGVLLYPQIVSKDVFVAMNPVEERPEPGRLETKNVKQEEPAPSTVAASPTEKPLAPMDDVAVAEQTAPEVAADPMADPALEDSVPDVNNLNSPVAKDDDTPANEAGNPDIGKNPFTPLLAAKDVPSDLQEDDALYDIPGQKTADGMAPIKGELPSMNQEFLSESDEQELWGNQMNKRLSQRTAQTQQNSPNNFIQKELPMESAPVPGSYLVLQKSVLEENKLPNPERVKVDQWLDYLGVSELVKTTEDKTEGADPKDIQFAKAVNQFATLLSSSEPADVKDIEEVLDMLKDSVGDDAKRVEFKSIVEKTIEIVKKLSE